MIVYKATCLINNKIYIGKTKNDINKRIKQHINKSNRGSDLIFHKAIKKYGIENFKWDILGTLNNEIELGEYEIKTIKELNSTNVEIGYNIATGGNGGDTISNHPRKKEIANNVSKFHKNKKLTEQHKKNIGKANENVQRDNSHLKDPKIRKKIWATRKKNGTVYNHSDDTKNKISKSLEGKTKPPRTKEHLDKLALSNKTIDKSAKIRGKTWEEIYGPERAKELKELRTLKALQRKNGTGIS